MRILLLFSYVISVFSADCILVMPPFPLTLNGLLTPYRLQSVNPADPCLMNPATAAFVEATILDLDTRKLMVYHPLVVNDGTVPFNPPAPFTLPANSVVSLSFGTNANTLRLTPPESVLAGKCVNGISAQDLFGQFAYCNSEAIYEAVDQWIVAGIDPVPPLPPLGTANDGKECLTTRHFMLVDQDPSDNVVTTYLQDPVSMKVMQDSPNNRLLHPTFIILKNGSDNRLLVTMNAAMQCKPYLVPLMNDGASLSASMVLNEIHATYRQGSPMVLLPARDPMTRVLVNGQPVPSVIKNNLYRKGIHQPAITTPQDADTAPFCGHMLNQIGRLQENKALFSTQLSPDPAASNLFTFLSNRFFQSYNNLKCDVLLDLLNPVTLVLTNQVVTDATFAVVQEYVFAGRDPYQPTVIPTVIPTIIPNTTVSPTVTPTDIPTVIPTAIPINTAQGITIIYIVFGSLAGIILFTVVWYKCRTPVTPLLMVPEKAILLPPISQEHMTRMDSPRFPARSAPRK